LYKLISYEAVRSILSVNSSQYLHLFYLYILPGLLTVPTKSTRSKRPTFPVEKSIPSSKSELHGKFETIFDKAQTHM